MLTFKHIMGYKETALEIGSYLIDRSNDRVRIQCFSDVQGEDCIGNWGGYQSPDSVGENAEVVGAAAYIMNSSGSTIAKADYFFAATSLVDCEPAGGMPFPEDTLQKEA